MASKYPRQIVAVKRTNKVLGVDAWLFSPSEDGPAAPLETVGYSRFLMTLVDSSQGETITPKANIPADDVRYIKFRTDVALQQMMTQKSVAVPEQAASSEELERNSPAFTQKLADKKFKGKTPAEALMEDPKNKEELIRVRAWLENNISRFPNNRYQISAIDDAITLLEIGELIPRQGVGAVSVTTGVQPIDIYSTEFKFFSTTKDGTNEHLVYNVNITCDTTKNYPFIINIQNCYAPVENGPGGKKKVIMSAATDIQKSTIMCTAQEWFSVISKMEVTLDHFEMMHFPTQYNALMKSSFSPAN